MSVDDSTPSEEIIGDGVAAAILPLQGLLKLLVRKGVLTKDEVAIELKELIDFANSLQPRPPVYKVWDSMLAELEGQNIQPMD